mmetsp:Transcript_31309/g.22682  ORF Transcript_31309/g.22682 Transcript_31309/m.22682 type:complete len:81 (+) Transcript_31309:923-1165(+)
MGLTLFEFKKYHKNYNNCINAFKTALKKKPSLEWEPDMYYHIGLSYCRLYKFDKSIYPLSKAIEKAPNDLRYVHERAKAY